MDGAPTGSSIIIEHAENVPTHSEDPEFKARITSIANSYLQGRPTTTLSTALRGPFTQSWQNPWQRKSKRRRLSASDDTLPNSALQACTPKANNKTSDKNDENGVPRSALAKSLSGSAHQDDQTGSVRVRSAQQNREGGYQQDHTNTLEQRAFPPATIGASVATEKNEQQPLDVPSDQARRPRRSTSSDVQDHRVAIPSPAAVQNTKHHPSSGLGKVAGFLGETPALQRRMRRPVGKPSLNRSCVWCGTSNSYQWRKGPDGPATLCSSCGAKWTAQQKKAKAVGSKRATGAKRAHEKAHGSRMNPRAGSNNKEVPPERTKTSSLGVARHTLSHEQICEAMFPHTELREAVTSDQAQKIEELLNREVLNLRGQPSPAMRHWDKTPSKKRRVSQYDGVLESNDGKSPRCKLDQALDGTRECSLQNAGSPRPATKKRKVLTFDTPRNHVPQRLQSNRSILKQTNTTNPPQPDPGPLAGDVAHADIETSENSGEVEGQDTGPGKSVMITTEQEDIAEPTPLAATTPLTNHNRAVQGGQDASPRRQSTKHGYSQVSTQAALIHAQEAFQENLRLSDEQSMQPVSLAMQLNTPSTHSTYARTPTRSEQQSAPVPACTQDMFNETLHFGTPSPMKQSQADTARFDFPKSAEQGRQDVRMFEEADLPTSPPTSQPEFDNSAEQHDGEETASEQDFSLDITTKVGQTPRSPDGRLSPPLFSSATRLISRTPMQTGPGQPESSGLCSQGVNVDEVMAEAGSFLDTWRT